MNDEQRYKKALEQIHETYVTCSTAWELADKALNPKPITAKDILDSLRKVGDRASIRFFSDESGEVLVGGDRVRDFRYLSEALDYLNTW